jgi:hypothetical protein
MEKLKERHRARKERGGGLAGLLPRRKSVEVDDDGAGAMVELQEATTQPGLAGKVPLFGSKVRGG